MLNGTELSRPRPWLGYLVLFVAGLAPFAGLLDVSFLKDDLNLMQLAGPDGRASFDAYMRWFGWPLGVYEHDPFYRPLPMLLGYCEFALFGANPAGFRTSNLVFHALNGVLLASLVDRMTGRRRPYAALLAGLLFVLHPAHGEAVVWIAQRFVVHSAFWTLAALHGLESFLASRSRLGAVGAALAAVAAALSKETAAVMPAIFAAYVLCREDGGSLRNRMRTAILAGLAAAPIAALVVALRFALFGAWTGTYAGVPVAEYARTRGTYERFPESLWNGLVGVNPYEASSAFRSAAALLVGILLLAGVTALIRARKSSATLRTALFGVLFAAISLAPMLPIFYCEPWLAGARFLYQPLAGLSALMIAGAYGRANGDGILPRPWPAVAAVVLFAVVGAVNGEAYRGADRQIRGLQEGILREDDAAARTAFVLHRAPAEHHGVPTVDLYVPLLVRPPLTDGREVLVFPIVAGAERRFDAEGFARFRSGHPEARTEHLYFHATPPGVGRLFGTPRKSAGYAPELFAPEDGAILTVPDLRGRAVDAASDAAIVASAPVLGFGPAADAARYRLHVSLAEAGTSERPVSPRSFALTLDPKTRLKRFGTGFRYRFSDGAEEFPSGTPDPWTHLARSGFEPPPLLIVWSVEALDAAGRSIGVSDERRMVVFPQDPAPRGS